MSRLNARQEAFCREYVIRKDAKASATAAGYAKNRAKQTGFELLQYDHINYEIARLQTIRDAEFGIEAADVVREIAAIAMIDIGRLLTWGMEEVKDEDGNTVRPTNGKPVMRPFCRPVSSHQMTEHERRAIKSISMSRNGTFKIELHDKLKAFELLARHMGIFETSNRTNTDGPVDTLSQLISACQGTPLMPKTMVYDA